MDLDSFLNEGVCKISSLNSHLRVHIIIVPICTLPSHAVSTATLTTYTSLILCAFLSPLNIQTEVSHLRIHYFMSCTYTIIGILKYPF